MAKTRRRKRNVVEESDESGASVPAMQMQQRSTFLQDSAYRPAVGRVTRRSSLLNNQSATIPTRYPLLNLSPSNHSSIGARRILSEASDEQSPETHESELPHENEIPISPVISTRYLNQHAQQVESQEKFASKVLSQTETPPGFLRTIPQTQLHEKLTEKTATSQTDNNIQLNRCSSLNMTEIALRCNNSSLDDDDDEVESTFNPARVTVEGYRVKPEVALLLRHIFAKYGDIANDSILKSSESRSHFLEVVCCIYQNLKNTKFAEVTPVELNTMLHHIDDLESMKMNVGWLHSKLTDMREVKELLREYPGFKEEKAEIERKEKALENYQAELASLQQAVLLLREELTAMKTKNVQTSRKFLKMKDKIKAFFEKSLVDGLL